MSHLEVVILVSWSQEQRTHVFNSDIGVNSQSLLHITKILTNLTKKGRIYRKDTGVDHETPRKKCSWAQEQLESQNSVSHCDWLLNIYLVFLSHLR